MIIINSFFRKSLYAAVVLICSDAIAQAEDPVGKKVSKGGLEEVVVTAQRREENAQDVAISITVFNQEQINDANMTNSSDLATYTPSLTTNTRFGNEMSSFAIRGFTQDLRTTASVATYFAEVVAPRGQSSQTSGDGAGPGDLFDLQNVQVLKGPQGTLFGRNTTGGAVLIVPQRPTDDFDGYIQASAGNYNAERIQAVANTPFSDSIRLRFGLDKSKRDGHLNNYTNVGAKKLGNTDYEAFRLSILLSFTENIENYTIISVLDSRTSGYTSTLFECNENPSPDSNTFYAVTGVGCVNQLNEQASIGKDGFYDLASVVPTPLTTIELTRIINTTSWDISENITVKNITAYAHLESNNGSNIFGLNFPETGVGLLPLPGVQLGPIDNRRRFNVGVSLIPPDRPVVSQQTVVEELRIQGLSLEDKLFWQAGVYYENSQPDGFSGNNAASLLSCELSTIEQADPALFNCSDPLGGAVGGVLIQEFKTEYLNKAVYAQAAFDISKVLSATLGLRYTWDDTEGYGIKTLYKYAGNVQQPPVISVETPEESSEAPTGMIEFNYHPRDELMMYGKYTRGYRQGSVNLAADPGVNTHSPETVDTYEIGAKTEFGGWFPGIFNIAVFYNDFTDMQLQAGYVSTTSGPTTAIANAGKAEIAGFEAEAMLRLTENLRANLSFSHLETELIEQEDYSARVAAASPSGAFTYTPIADTGDELPFAPDNSAVVSLMYSLPVPQAVGQIEMGATYVYTGEQRATATSASPNDMIDAFELLNLNMSWAAVFGTAVDLSLYVTNVLDEEYVTYLSGTYNALGFDSRMVGIPRMYGARLNYRFGASGHN
ncbi:TonB-dependent receptor [Zhongshania sp.]|uniref:TonB-dependent receptor n=1 Tax=Zhongshania sp. TaxID=1971902 RepID=UPI00356A41CB